MAEGLPGLDGLSAYEIARAKGYRGTVAAWLDSLKGPPGRDGKDGADVDPAEVQSLVERAVAEIPRPRDGSDGRNGNDGERGLKGDQGAPGADAKPVPLVPWLADYERDPETDLTQKVTLKPAPSSGLSQWALVPHRINGLIRTVSIFPVEMEPSAAAGISTL